MQEELNYVESSSVQVKEMVDHIVGDTTNDIDNYVDGIKSVFLNNNVSDADLDKIILQIPVYIYYLTTIIQDLEVKKGISNETAKFKENESLLMVTGTVAEKQAKASNSAIKERAVQLAYKVASSMVQSKVNSAMEILSSAKKVQQRRLEEMKLTKMAGNSVGTF